MKQRTKGCSFFVTAIVCCLLTVLLMANAFVKVDQNVAANASANDLPVILLDAGHGGEDGGAGENGVQEKDVNLAVALQLQEFLEMSGFRVVMTRRPMFPFTTIQLLPSGKKGFRSSQPAQVDRTIPRLHLHQHPSKPV